METLTPQVVSYYREVSNERIKSLGTLLAWSSLILGIAPPVSGDDPRFLIESIWKIVDTPPGRSLHDEWDECRSSCHLVRATLNEAINSCCAAFQGSGSTVLSIDVERIVSLLQSEIIYSEVSTQAINSLYPPGSNAYKSMKVVSTLTRTLSLKGRLSKTIKLIKEGEGILGQLFHPGEDIAKAVKELKKLISDSQSDGMSWPNTLEVNSQQLLSSVETLEKSDVDHLRDKLSEIQERFEGQQYPEVIYEIGLLSPPDFFPATSAAREVSHFLLEMDKKVDELTRLASGNDPGPVAEKIEILLDELNSQLTLLQEAKHDAP